MQSSETNQLSKSQIVCQDKLDVDYIPTFGPSLEESKTLVASQAVNSPVIQPDLYEERKEEFR